MTDDWTNDLHGRLADAVRVLREEPEISDEWSASLHQRLEGAGQPPSRVQSRRWQVHPIAAIAACVTCVVLGGAVTYATMRSRQSAAGSIVEIASRDVATAPTNLPVRFSFVAPGANHVTIAGDFNQWNPIALPMRRLPDGHTWVVDVTLAPGRYAYSFIVDGRLAQDPTAPDAGSDDFGVRSSVILVKGS